MDFAADAASGRVAGRGSRRGPAHCPAPKKYWSQRVIQRSWSVCLTMETIDPNVRAILDDIVIEDDGVQFIRNYARWVKTLTNLPPKANSRIFVQLAVLAKQFSDANCKPVAMSLAALARF